MSRSVRRIMWMGIVMAVVLVLASSAWAAPDGDDMLYLPLVSGPNTAVVGDDTGDAQEQEVNTTVTDEGSEDLPSPGDGDISPAPPAGDSLPALAEDIIAPEEEETGPAQDPSLFDGDAAEPEQPVEAAAPASPDAWTHNNAYIRYKLGVGTQSPTWQIDVKKNRNGLTRLRVKNASATKYARADIYVQTTYNKGVTIQQYGPSYVGNYMGKTIRDWTVIRSDTGSDGMIVATGGYDPLVFGTWDNERMRITESGRVGIGTAYPNSLTKLHVYGKRIRLQNGSKILDLRADGGAVDVQTLTNSLYIRSTGTGHHVYINPFGSDGNIYVGSGGSSKLDIKGNLRIKGYAPIYIRRYQNIGSGTYINTGVSSATYVCTVGGWSARWDINENGTGSNYVWTYVVSGTWRLRTNFYSHYNHENLDIDLICFRNEIVSFYPSSLKTLFHPD